MTVRLVVRRVRPTPGSQLALFTTWDYHAFVTNRPGDMLEIEADHRRHAVVEQRIAELESAGLAHQRCFRRFSLVGSAAGQRSAKVMAKALRAGFHRIAHRALPGPVGSRDRVTRYRHFSAACSVGKCPRALTARR